MSLYDGLFHFAALDEVFADEQIVQAMLDFEAALARAEVAAGVIPQASAQRIASKCRVEYFPLAELKKQAASAGNIAIPLVKQLTELVAAENRDAARFVHWGATSQDAIDTGTILQTRRALELIRHDLDRLITQLAALAATHQSTLMVARTWMQQALPTTFGFVVACWVDALLRHRTRIAQLAPRVLVLQFGGAVGTLAALAGRGADVAKALAEELRLTLPAVPWHTHRDRIVELGAALGLLTGTLGKIARDISLLAQTEVGELAEPSGEGRGGSSTLPHKRNPVTCSMVLSAAQRVPGLVSTLLVSMPQEHQRGLGGWHAEWETLPGLTRLNGGALHHLADMVPGLVVDTERMRKNLDATHGLIFAEAVTMALADRMGKQTAHMLVAAACKESLAEHRDLKEILVAEPGLHGHFTSADLESLFTAENYLGNARDFTKAVLAEVSRISANGRTKG
jgi:3-carboxy-cis,cis-muconate cycloisomerase